MKYKVLFITHVLNYSGAPKALFNLLRYFPKNERNNYSFKVLGLRQNYSLKDFNIVADYVEVITPYPPTNFLQKGIERFLSIPKIWKSIKNFSPNLVFINSAANSRAIILAKILKLPVWIYVHEFDEGFIAFPKIRRQSILLADRILVTNKYQLPWIKQVGYKGPVDILPNAFSLEEKSPHNFSIDPSFLNFVKNFSFIVANIGFISHLKGWDLFLNVIQCLSTDPSIGFVIIGDFLKAREKSLFMNRVFKCNLQNRIFITGIKPNIIPYLNYIDCVAITSRSETFSRVILESMSFSIPVVAFKLPAFAFVFPKNYKFLAPCFDIETFASLIKDIKSMPKNQRKLLMKSYKKHLENFEAKQVASLFAKLLKSFFEK